MGNPSRCIEHAVFSRNLARVVRNQRNPELGFALSGESEFLCRVVQACLVDLHRIGRYRQHSTVVGLKVAVNVSQLDQLIHAVFMTTNNQINVLSVSHR